MRWVAPTEKDEANHAHARFDYLLRRPEGSNVGKAVNEAMADIEKHNPQLAGVLPRNYQIFNGALLKTCG